MPKQRRSLMIVVVVVAVVAAFFGFRALTKGDEPEKISLDRYTRAARRTARSRPRPSTTRTTPSPVS